MRGGKKAISVFIFILFSILMAAQTPSDKLIRQGVSLHDRGKYADAISCYQQALTISPLSVSALYEMSLSYLKMEDYDNAIIHSSQVILVGFRPLLVDAYVVKGTALAAQNKLDEAIKLFSDGIVQCGDEYLLHYNLGLSYFNKNNPDLALIHLKKAIQKDSTHSSVFLLYAYVLNDLNNWIESFYSFHFFLLLEPNTTRSTDAFKEMYNIIDARLAPESPRLKDSDGINRKKLLEIIQVNRPSKTDTESRYAYFETATKEIFFQLNKINEESRSGLLWEFFVPIYGEILNSGHFSTYCKYVSVSYFPESLKWWEVHKENVDSFIEWFEQGESPDIEEDAHFD